MRSLSILRVVLWHTFGAAWITYVVSAVPAMFFVTGSLLARSFDRRGVKATLIDRGRRLLVPLWLFTATSWFVMAIANRLSPSPKTALPWAQLLWWILPLDDPRGSLWEAGWLSSPLWYLRAMTWLLLVAPLLRRVSRRRPGIGATVLLVLVVGLDLTVDFNPLLSSTGRHVGWMIGDLALYALFVLAGFCHRDGRFATINRSQWLQYAAGAGVAAAIWAATQPVPNRVVNDSHPLHLLMGTAWLALGLAFAPQLAALGQRRSARGLVTWLTRRSLTVYLWHAVGIVVAYRTVKTIGASLPGGIANAALLMMVAGVTVALAILVGGVEDLAGRRQVSWWPVPVAPLDSSVRPIEPHRRYRQARLPFTVVAASSVVACFGAFTSIPQGSSTATVVLPRAPSKAPTLPAPMKVSTRPVSPAASTEETSAATSTTKAPGPPLYLAQADSGVSSTGLSAWLAPAASLEVAAALHDEVEAWLAETEISGVEFLVLRPGELLWRAALGVDPLDGRSLKVGQPFDSNSITKTFTAALVYRLVEEGKLDLDEPVPALHAVPDYQAGEFTARQLLSHRSGLANYRDTPEFSSPSGLTNPRDALQASLDAPRVNEPDEAAVYSSSNYLMLGFLIEQVTGRRYDELLRQTLLEPLHLTRTSHSPPAKGWPNFSTGGVVTTTDDLARWLVALLRDEAVVGAESIAQMADIDRATGLGAGAWGYCPCTVDDDGYVGFAGVGHSGGTSQMQFSATDDLVIVANMTSAIPELGDGRDALSPLFQRLRDILNNTS